MLLCSPRYCALRMFARTANRYGSWICLDMLEGQWVPNLGDHKNDLYCGWTSAYTMHSILLQLQSFLTDSKKVNTQPWAVHKAVRTAAAVRCKCSHTAQHPFPALPMQAKPTPAPKSATNDAVSNPLAYVARDMYTPSGALLTRVPTGEDGAGAGEGEAAAATTAAAATASQSDDSCSSRSSGSDSAGGARGVAPSAALANSGSAEASPDDAVPSITAGARTVRHGDKLEAVVAAITPGIGVTLSLQAFPGVLARVCRTQLRREEFAHGQ